MAQDQEQVKLKGVYLVPDARMLKPHFGPSEHIRVGLEQLKKYFDIELLVLGTFDAGQTSGQKTSITKGKATGNGFVGLLRDIKLLVNSNAGKDELVRQLRERKVDFIYERGQYLDFRGIRAAKALGKRHFYEVNWLNFLGIRQFYYSWFNPIAKKLEERAYASTTLNFFIGTQHKLLDVKADKVCTIQNGVEEALIVSNQTHTLPAKSGFRMCYVANLMPHHRFDILLQALRLANLPADTELHVVGYNFEEVIKLVPPEIRVVNHGPVKKELLPAIIRQCNVGVISGGPSYSSFMKLFEYAAFRQCIVCPDLENVQLMFDDSEIAYFRTDDARSLAATLNRLSADSHLVRQFGNNVYAKVREQYTWEKIYEGVASRIRQCTMA